MEVPKIYRNTIPEMESIFRLCANQLPTFDGNVFLFCHHQKPNSYEKKVAVRFIDKDGEGYDVYDYDNELKYTTTTSPNSDVIGPALLKNIETIFPDINKMIKMTAYFHGEEINR